jgi:broad specificity phosphatase PhoE
MTVVYLLRHGEADYGHYERRGWPGATADLAPLSPRGEREALAAADALSEVGATAVVSSPMTRALQTAGIVAAYLGLPLEVEFDLHEWLPDETFSWRTYAEVQAASADFEACGFEWPPGERRTWEPLSQVRARATAALESATAGLADDDVLIAACHGFVIWSLTGIRGTDTGQWHRIEFAGIGVA